MDKYLTPLNDYIYYPKNTMANRADIGYACISAGLIQRDYKRIAISVEKLRVLLDNVEVGEGFYDDGSFIQHDIYAYTGAYGLSLIHSLFKVSYILEDTCFQLDEDMKERQYNWIINSFIPVVYDGAFFDLIRGRDVTKNIVGLKTGKNLMRSFAFSTKYIKNSNNLKNIKTYLKYLYSKHLDYYINNLNIGTIVLIKEIMADESIKAEYLIPNFS